MLLVQKVFLSRHPGRLFCSGGRLFSVLSVATHWVSGSPQALRCSTMPQVFVAAEQEKKLSITKPRGALAYALAKRKRHADLFMQPILVVKTPDTTQKCVNDPSEHFEGANTADAEKKRDRLHPLTSNSL